MLSKISVSAVLACSLYSTASFAAAGPQFSGPVGATDLGNAYLPGKDGLYIGFTDFFAYADRAYNNRHQPQSGAANGNDVALYGLYVYPFKLLGGTLASGINVAYQTSTYVTISGAGSQSASGWRDLYVDLIQWSRYIGPLFGEHVPDPAQGDHNPYGLTVKAQYSMIFPTGHYDPRAITNASGGTYFFIPNAAATYLTPPDFLGGGVELDLHFFFNAQSTNREFARLSNYTSGDVIDLDYAVGQKLGRWTVGVTGSYTFQLGSDHIQVNNRRVAVPPKGNHLESFSLGPIVSYYVPDLNLNLKLKAPISIQARNTLGLTGVIFNAFVGF